MSEFIRVADRLGLSTRRGTRATADGADIALFLVDDEIVAVQNDCPHQHFSRLHEGILRGCEITCPMHGWTFDLKTGRATTGSGRLKRYEVNVVGDNVLIRARERDPRWG